MPVPITTTGTLLLAGGGSGGHIAPGIAIAETVRKSWPDIEPVFLCSQRPVDASMLEHVGANYTALPAVPPSIRPGQAIKFLNSHRQCKRHVKQLIRQIQKQKTKEQENRIWMLSLGGYVSVAPSLAAYAMGIPLALLNLDAVPGKANRLVARKASLVMAALPLVAPERLKHQVVSYPIRQVTRAPYAPEECRRRLGLDAAKPVLLITGASQGAQSLNEFMATWVKTQPPELEGWQIAHLTGPGRHQDQLKQVYTASGIQAHVMPFGHEMGLYWGAADAALSRAGANSVGEAVMNGVPTLFAPYPFHRDQHQRHNAQPIVDAGGACLAIDQVDPDSNCQALGAPLGRLLADETARYQMKQVLLERSDPDGATQVLEALLDIDSPNS